MLSEIESAKAKTDRYAKDLESKIKAPTKQLGKLSRTDPLTGLLNLRLLQERLIEVLRAAKRRDEPVSLAYIDIDNFKKIDDPQGHQQGDEILRGGAERIRHISRRKDSCFRYGGDEFCIILPNCSEQATQQNYQLRLEQE